MVTEGSVVTCVEVLVEDVGVGGVGCLDDVDGVLGDCVHLHGNIRQ